MNEAELQKLVEEISIKAFGRPFVHQVKINRRMKTTGGRYHLDDHHLEINAHFLEAENRQYLAGIIKHELTHYHLHLLGLGYQHKDRDFKVLLKRVGGSRYAPNIGQGRRQQRKYLYQCQKCGLKYPRVRKINTRRYFCGRCGGQLRLVEHLN
ncbi:SprT family protein [Lactobacillus porci]|jgi:SprT-like protein|uniref:SprT family protein n=1 Tax=Lactobacillus porci TaxID=2012477 RepID=UPI0039949982